jgi:hypothetical protein
MVSTIHLQPAAGQFDKLVVIAGCGDRNQASKINNFS